MKKQQICRLDIGGRSYELTNVEMSQTDPPSEIQTWDLTPAHWSLCLDSNAHHGLDEIFEMFAEQMSNNIDLSTYIKFVRDRGYEIRAAWVDKWSSELRFDVKENRDEGTG